MCDKLCFEVKERENMKISEVQELIQESSYPYLGADKDMWINADGVHVYIGNMSYEYIKNSYDLLKRQEHDIKRGYFLQGVKYDKNKYNDIVELAIQLYEKKLQELKERL